MTESAASGKGWIKTLTPSYRVSAAQREAFVQRQIEYVENAHQYQQDQRDLILARIGRPRPGAFTRCICGHIHRDHSDDPTQWDICVDGCTCTYFRAARAAQPSS